MGGRGLYSCEYVYVYRCVCGFVTQYRLRKYGNTASNPGLGWELELGNTFNQISVSEEFSKEEECEGIGGIEVLKEQKVITLQGRRYPMDYFSSKALMIYGQKGTYEGTSLYKEDFSIIAFHSRFLFCTVFPFGVPFESTQQ